MLSYRKLRRGGSCLGQVRRGQVVQVLGERHEWIAIGYEAGEDLVSGWVMKKYTTKKVSFEFVDRKDRRHRSESKG